MTVSTLDQSETPALVHTEPFPPRAVRPLFVLPRCAACAEQIKVMQKSLCDFRAWPPTHAALRYSFALQSTLHTDGLAKAQDRMDKVQGEEERGGEALVAGLPVSPLSPVPSCSPAMPWLAALAARKTFRLVWCL